MLGVVLLVVAVAAAALVVSWCVSRARRLDRLHVRLDAARAALGGALERRAAVAVRIADGAPPPAPARPRDPADTTPLPAVPPDAVPLLRAAALSARRGARPAGAALGEVAGREDAESALTRALATVDRGRLGPRVHEELVDAEQLVVLARRVHNDAVRDTLALRSRRLVRWLRLAGTAPEPVYFDIAEPEPDRFPFARPESADGAPEGRDRSRTLG